MLEKPKRFGEITGKVERVQDKVPQKEGAATFAEKWRTPEEGAEELYALWRDYNRKKVSVYKEAIRNAGGVDKERKRVKVDEAKRESITSLVDADPRLLPYRTAIRARFQDSQVREFFEANLERELEQEEKLAPSYENYSHQRRLKDEAEARRLELYSEIFSHREREADELTLLELKDIDIRIRIADREMQRMEKSDPELAAHLSFERLSSYREQLKKGGFIWTPSREKLFDKISRHLVIINRNQPILLHGETGTGKTELARAVSKRLTGRLPYEVGEESKTDIRPLLGRLMQDKEGTYISYGPLGQALTGKKISRDKTASSGGIFYMDEINGYPPDALRALIKQISGRKAGDEVSFAAWGGVYEKVAPGFAFLSSANLPSEKHPDRSDLPVEVAREFAETNGAIEVDYPLQSIDDPELYEMMLTALMDQNDRIRSLRGELSPEWKEVVDAGTDTKHFEIDTDPKAGGTLWRFATLVSEIQKSYKGENNVLSDALRDGSYLRAAVLSPKVLLWLEEYRKSAMRSGETLSAFLSKKISDWGSQKLYPEEDRNLIKKFQEEFALE